MTYNYKLILTYYLVSQTPASTYQIIDISRYSHLTINISRSFPGRQLNLLAIGLFFVSQPHSMFMTISSCEVDEPETAVKFNYNTYFFVAELKELDYMDYILFII